MFTTSRYASADTRKLAKKMAKENSEQYISRGKRTIAGLAQLARREGEENIHMIEEEDDKPALLVTISVKETGEWKWTGEEHIDKKRDESDENQVHD